MSPTVSTSFSSVIDRWGALQRPGDAKLAASTLIREEVEGLAARLMNAFFESPQVAVSYTEALGFKVRQVSAGEDAYPFAQALALASGAKVTLHGLESPGEVIVPPPIRLLLPEGYSPISCVDQLVDLSARAVINQLLGRSHVAPNRGDAQAILEASDFKSSITIGENRFGGGLLQCSGDLSILGDKRFFELLKELAASTDVIRAVLVPSASTVEAKVRELLGNDAAWKFTPQTKLSPHKISFDVNDTISDEKAARIASRIGLLTGAEIVTDRVPLLKGQLVRKPGSLDLRSDGASAEVYLHGIPAVKDECSNIQRVSIPFSLEPGSLRDFLGGRIGTGECYTVFDYARNSHKIPTEQYVFSLRSLGRELELNGLRVESAPLRVYLTHPEQITDYSKLELFLEYLAVTQNPLSVKPEIFCPNDETSIAVYLESQLGLESEWSFSVNSAHISLETRGSQLPANFSTLTHRYIGKRLTLVRNPEPSSGTVLSATVDVPRGRAWDNIRSVTESAAQLLPSAFGPDPVVRLAGNRVIVYSKTADLPSAYLTAAREELYGIGIPVIFRNDYQAQKIKTTPILRDVVTRSLPRGMYLSSIEDSENQFTVCLYQRENAHFDLERFQREIERCTDRPVAFRLSAPSEQLESLFSDATDERSMRFFARAMYDGFRIQSISNLRSLFLEVFESGASEHIRFAPDSSRIYRARDLTHLDCFSIDGEETNLREDAFSIERKSSGRIEFGIHLINAAHLVPYGSAADAMAQSHGINNNADLGSESLSFNVLPYYIKRNFSLDLNESREVLSLFFETDSQFNIIPNSHRLDICEIQNKRYFTYEGIERGEIRDQRIDDLENFCLANPGHSNVPINLSFQPNPRAMVGAMLRIFNSSAAETLAHANIAIPAILAPAQWELRDVAKLNAPARSYSALLTQRQLEAFIADREPLSAEQISFHESRQGYPATRSSAFQFLTTAYRVSMENDFSELGVSPEGKIFPYREDIS